MLGMSNSKKVVTPTISLSELRDYGVTNLDADEIELISKDGDLGERRSRAVSGVSLARSDMSYASNNSTSRHFSQGTRHLSLASDTTRVTSNGLDPRRTRHSSKQSLLSTSHLIVEDDPNERAINHVDRLWTPWSLRKPVLIGLAVLFLLFIITLEILAFFSRKNNGISSLGSTPPLWAYIPIVIFFIQAALWHNLEQRVKQLTPWQQLAKGPTSGNHGLLLDYVSPWNIVSFFRSLKSAHYAVALTILGSFLIKLIIISAAALIGPKSSLVPSDASLGLLNQFSGGGLNMQAITVQDGLMGLTNSSQPGVYGNWVHQSLKPLNKSEGVQTASASVDAFFADLDCEPSTSIRVSNVTCANTGESTCETRWSFAVASGDCDTGPTTGFVDSGPFGTNGTQRFGVASLASCESSNSDDSARVIVTTGYLDWEGTNSTKFANATTLNSTNLIPVTASGSRQFINATSLLCKPTYSLQQTLLRMGQNGSTINPTPNRSNGSTIPGVSAALIAQSVLKAISLLGVGAHSNGTVQGSTFSGSPFNQSDSIVAAISLLRSDLDLSKIDDIETGLRQLYSSTAVQIAKNHLLTSSDATIQGSVLHVEKRLHIREVPLRLMEVSLVLLIVIRILLIRLSPAPATPRDLTSLSGLATVMAQSQGYVFALQGLGAASLRTIKQKVGLQRFQTVVNLDGEERAFRINVVDGDEEFAPPNLTPNLSAKPTQWWVPTTDATRMGILAATFGLLVAVELLLQRSQKENGLTTMSVTSSVGYTWIYVPAVLCVFLWMLYGLIDFSTRLAQPYLELKKAPVTARRSLHLSYTSQITVLTVKDAILNKQFAVALAAFTMLLAALVTVVSAGLFMPSIARQRLSTNLNAADSIDVHAQTAGAESSLPMTASLVASGNTSTWPQWTSDSLVFQKTQLPSSMSGLANSGNSTVDTRLPGLLASLNCKAIASGDIIGDVPDISLAVPQGCGVPCANAQDRDCVEVPDFFPVAGNFYGRLFTMKTNPTPSGWNDDCPHIGVVFGKIAASSQRSDSIFAMTCFPTITQTQTNITFAVPSWSILSASAGTKNKTEVAKGDDATIDLNSVLLVSAVPPSYANTDFDTAFKYLLRGRDHISLSQLQGDGSVQAVTDGFERLYGRVMAQQLNLNARKPPASSEGQSVKATLDAQTLRLHQNVTTTRLIEALLGAMFLCVVLSSVFGDARKAIPNNPCSIAAMSALIADSEFVKKDIVPAGSEWCDNQELIRRSVFEGYMLSLGIWDKKSVGVFGIDIGKAEKAD